MRQVKQVGSDVFLRKLSQYKQKIDDDIAAHVKEQQQATLQEFGKNARLASDAYLEILSRGGKRIRGVLAMFAYEVSGGKDQSMILQAARALEMLHAYILIIDDIQDRSLVRRDGPAAHVILSQYHKEKELAGDGDHFGISLALNAAFEGSHAANKLLSELDVDDSLKIKVLSMVNATMTMTAHGQTSDIMNEVVASVEEADVQRVLEWKTAHYTFLNPLRVGMVLAGAHEQQLSAIKDFAMHAGILFQITDDIMGTFGSEFESGKSPMDDMREGKRTLLTVYALKHASNGNQNFLLQMLGNEHLTPAEFERCKKILQECGALDHAQNLAQNAAREATQALEPMKKYWSDEDIVFLEQLVGYLVNRKV